MLKRIEVSYIKWWKISMFYQMDVWVNHILLRLHGQNMVIVGFHVIILQSKLCFHWVL